MKVYISGPITGVDNYLDRFVNIQIRLEHEGFEVINPAAVNSKLPSSTTYDQYMKMSLMMLDMADAIYLIDGWEQSHGAGIEYGYAYAKDKVLMYEKQNI